MNVLSHVLGLLPIIDNLNHANFQRIILQPHIIWKQITKIYQKVSLSKWPSHSPKDSRVHSELLLMYFILGINKRKAHTFKERSGLSKARASSSIIAHGTAESVAPTNTLWSQWGKYLESQWQARTKCRLAVGLRVLMIFEKDRYPRGVLLKKVSTSKTQSASSL